ncbi:hypothetical protein AB0B94_31130 [Micromonospora sp. NPDC048986]|uniref:hypothetical protein n=1 Tax=Micromonospora sp. NPDC048986 TaxID=3155644 RepID=UPI0033FA9946
MITPQQTATVTKRHLTAVAVLLLAGAVAGCDSGSSSTPATSGTTQAASASKTPAATRYDTPQALVGALETGGINCGGYDPTEGVIGAVARGSCYIGDAEVVVSIYATKADAAGEPAKKHQLLAGVADVVMTVGENWTTSCDTPADCEKIAKVIGGQYTRIPM